MAIPTTPKLAHIFRLTGFLAGALLAMLAAWSPITMAALQGERGIEDSTATTLITLNIEPNLQISNVSDITLDVTDRTKDVQFEERVCIRGNLGSRYTVTAASQDGNQSPFRLKTEANDSIDYEVYFRGDLSQSTTDRLFPGQPSPFYEMQTKVQNCDGDDTAAFTIFFKSTDLQIAAPGTYSGFLTLTVAAE